jgi:hypothetical protein
MLPGKYVSPALFVKTYDPPDNTNRYPVAAPVKAICEKTELPLATERNEVKVGVPVRVHVFPRKNTPEPALENKA